MLIRLILLRHGLPTIKNSLLGQTDCDVSQNGFAQMSETFDSIPVQVNQIITSPLKRCYEFSSKLSDKTGVPISIYNDLRECNFGDWDGISYQTLHKDYPVQTEQFFTDPFNYSPPNAEHLTKFHNRCVNAITHFCNDIKSKNQKHFNCLVVTHAGVIRSLVAWALNFDFAKGEQFKHFDVDYASITELVVHCFDNSLFVKVHRLNWLPNVMEDLT
ncbi:MAG: histidine phosphatase family protein [Gammaproteobacteria bacterium]|nr:histidine phosphatase family protein [Gammaproteobacteria bacterium]